MMNTFIEMSQPREAAAQAECEKKLKALKELTTWFYEHGVKITIRPNRHGYCVIPSQLHTVIIRSK